MYDKVTPFGIAKLATLFSSPQVLENSPNAESGHMETYTRRRTEIHGHVPDHSADGRGSFCTNRQTPCGSPWLLSPHECASLVPTRPCLHRLKNHHEALQSPCVESAHIPIYTRLLYSNTGGLPVSDSVCAVSRTTQGRTDVKCGNHNYRQRRCTGSRTSGHLI